MGHQRMTRATMDDMNENLAPVRCVSERCHHSTGSLQKFPRPPPNGASEVQLEWLATDRRWLPKRHLAAKNPGCRGSNSLPPNTPRIGRALAQRQLVEKYLDTIASSRKNRERENLNHVLNSILVQTDFLPGMSRFPVRQIGRRAERSSIKNLSAMEEWTTSIREQKKEKEET